MAFNGRGLRCRAFAVLSILLLLQALPRSTSGGWPRLDGSATAAAEAAAPGTAAGLHLKPALASDDSLPDSTLAVPWLGNLWQTLPNLTWGACDVSDNTRQVIDLALKQWTYAANNQGVPIKFSELPCTNGSTSAQISIFEVDAAQLPNPDPDLLGETFTHNAQGQVCDIDVKGPCVAQDSETYLVTDNWQKLGLSNAQAAKTVAHEFGRAVGLATPHFCTFDSVMAQNCEPILQGLGPDDVQSIDALVNYARSYFGQTPINAQPPPPAPSGTGTAVTYKAGYNLVAGPRGTSFSAAGGSLFTYLPGDSAYETFDASQPVYNGYGFWAYFPRDTTVQLKGGNNQFFSAYPYIAPGQWFLIGNDNGTTPMRVLGATDVETYDPVSGQYVHATTLQPGQAAWVKPGRTDFIAVAATTLSAAQLSCYEDLGDPSTCGP